MTNWGKIFATSIMDKELIFLYKKYSHKSGRKRWTNQQKNEQRIRTVHRKELQITETQTKTPNLPTRERQIKLDKIPLFPVPQATIWKRESALCWLGCRDPGMCAHGYMRPWALDHIYREQPGDSLETKNACLPSAQPPPLQPSP